MEKQTILIMEDNEDINLLTKATLNYRGYKVLCSYNGKDGLQLAETYPVDLIILDVMMPDMDGYQVLEILKSNDKTKNIPVAFFSAKTQIDEIKRGIDLGAVKYFTKPFDPMTFLSEIENLLINNSKKK